MSVCERATRRGGAEGRVEGMCMVRRPHLNAPRVAALLPFLRYAGPLPITWRCFIAVIASARHNCVYLVRRQQDAFIAQGAWAHKASGRVAATK